MKKYHLFLIILFTIVWVWAAMNPVLRSDWLLENILVLIFVPLIIFLGRYFEFSNISYTCITIFLILHVIGSHYTYPEVPFGYTLQDFLGANRNMYDRLVHFSFGFLMAYPLREIFIRVSRARGFWAYYFPIDLILAGSAAYEIFEWLAASYIDPASGIAFLGTQGDVWDTQKDMLVAGAGAVLMMFVVAGINMALDSNFWKDMKQSFKLQKSDEPLGEVRLKQLLEKEL
jgi:putative membrane protein